MQFVNFRIAMKYKNKIETQTKLSYIYLVGRYLRHINHGFVDQATICHQQSLCAQWFGISVVFAVLHCIRQENENSCSEQST